jgi:hypothetical protein
MAVLFLRWHLSMSPRLTLNSWAQACATVTSKYKEFQQSNRNHEKEPHGNEKHSN